MMTPSPNPTAEPEGKKDLFDAEIGRRLQKLRLQHGLSQEKLGSKLGVSFQQVQKYEKGFNSVSLRKLLKICDIFGVGLSYFVNSPEKINQQPFEELTPNAFRAAVVLSKLPPKTRRIITGLMEAIQNRNES